MTKLEELKAAYDAADADHATAYAARDAASIAVDAASAVVKDAEIAFDAACDAFETAAAWATDAWYAYQDELNQIYGEI